MSLNAMFKRKEEGLCPFCGREVNMDDFRDDLSRHEFELSGLCQMCQDYFVKEEQKSMKEICDGCEYNIDEYCIMFDDVLGFEDCVFRKEE